jgi:hypothetical protein
MMKATVITFSMSWWAIESGTNHGHRVSRTIPHYHSRPRPPKTASWPLCPYKAVIHTTRPAQRAAPDMNSVIPQAQSPSTCGIRDCHSCQSAVNAPQSFLTVRDCWTVRYNSVYQTLL